MVSNQHRISGTNTNSKDVNKIKCLLLNLDDLRSRLMNIYPGNTCPIAELYHTIVDSGQRDNSYYCRFHREIMNYFSNRLFVGELTQEKTINRVEVLFYDQSNQAVLSPYGSLIRYISRADDLGHALELLELQFSFTYIEFVLTLQSDAPFNSQNLFFHFSHSISESR